MIKKDGNLAGDLRSVTNRDSTEEYVSNVLGEARAKVFDVYKQLAVSLNQAAAISGISRRSLENYVAAKLLASHKIGKRRIIFLRDLEKFLRKDQPSVGQKRQHDTRSGIAE